MKSIYVLHGQSTIIAYLSFIKGKIVILEYFSLLSLEPHYLIKRRSPVINCVTSGKLLVVIFPKIATRCFSKDFKLE
jgi:hypothetical protein